MKYNIVIDTNVLVAGLRSRRGTSFRLLQLFGGERLAIHISVPVALEYEDVLKRHSAMRKRSCAVCRSALRDT